LFRFDVWKSKADWLFAPFFYRPPLQQNEQKSMEPSVLNADRRMVPPFGRSFVDGGTTISVRLAIEVFKKAIVLEVATVNEEDGSVKHWEGQAGLIRQEKLTLSPAVRTPEFDGYPFSVVEARFQVVPVTAKHNIESRIVDHNNVHHYFSSEIFNAFTSKIGIITFPDGGWERTSEDIVSINELVEGAESPSGLDFTWGNRVASPRNFITAKSLSFDMVDPHFELASGQKIAIVVSRRSPGLSHTWRRVYPALSIWNATMVHIWNRISKQERFSLCLATVHFSP
jgi:hypothetical protein